MNPCLRRKSDALGRSDVAAPENGRAPGLGLRRAASFPRPGPILLAAFALGALVCPASATDPDHDKPAIKRTASPLTQDLSPLRAEGEGTAPGHGVKAQILVNPAGVS